MTLGATIKRLRRERDITQEQLAEYLNISASAVSQWETNRVMPDVSQIPILANIFDVSADMILGIDLEKKNERIQEILDKADQLIYNGDFQKAADELRTNSRIYPNVYSILAKLADTLLSCYIRGIDIADSKEIIELCRKVLAECVDQPVRSQAALTLCTAYKWMGNMEELQNIAEQMPEAAFSKEEFLFWNLTGEKAVDICREYMRFCLIRVLAGLSQLAGYKRADGNDIYSVEERIQLYEQIISVIECMFPDKDYQNQAQYAELASRNMAECFLKIGNQEKALDCLEQACQFAVHFDAYDAESAHTSAAWKGCSDGGWIMEPEGNRCAQLLEELGNNPAYNPIKDDGRFQRIMDTLEQYAVKIDT